ncbi:MAG TPA: TIR domain-containing protein, partial [Candidatus Nanopelagicales bacterium]|nr:TIR domain-containing protein [Candidatus Nanopelagicales bacterium]
MPGPIEVFISYAPQDIDLRRELEQHLAILKRQGLIRAWHVEQIGPGQGWRTAIESHVSTAQLILLLVSAPFFASDDCHDLEMARALQRWQRGEVQVVPILLSQCLWETSQLRRLQPLPDNRVPVTSWPSRAEAWANVARGIHRIVERMAHGSTAAMSNHAVISSRPAPTLPETPIQAPPRASAPSYPVMGPPSPRASAPSYPTAAPPSAGAGSLRSSVPNMQPARSDPRPSLDRAPASPRRSSCLLAGVLGLFALSAVAAGAVMLYRELSRHRASQPFEPAPVILPATPTPTVIAPIPARSGPGPAPEPEACAQPCCGGILCAADAENTAKSVCVAGSAQCEPCASGRACISGSCWTDLAPARPVL